MGKPSRWRREGRAAFIPGTDATAACPYHRDPWARENWLKGWEEGRQDYHDQMAAQEEYDNSPHVLIAELGELLAELIDIAPITTKRRNELRDWATKIEDRARSQ